MTIHERPTTWWWWPPTTPQALPSTDGEDVRKKAYEKVTVMVTDVDEPGDDHPVGAASPR